MAFKSTKVKADIDIDLTARAIEGEEVNLFVKPIKPINSEMTSEWTAFGNEAAKETKENEKQYKIEVGLLHKEVQRNEINEKEFLEFNKELIQSYNIKPTDPKEVTLDLIKRIDFWYNKGPEFWLKYTDFVLLQDIMEFLNLKLVGVKKKSTNSKHGRS